VQRLIRGQQEEDILRDPMPGPGRDTKQG